MRKTCT